MNLGFHAKYIWNVFSMLSYSVKVLLMAFTILFQICSAYCERDDSEINDNVFIQRVICEIVKLVGLVFYLYIFRLI